MQQKKKKIDRCVKIDASINVDETPLSKMHKHIQYSSTAQQTTRSKITIKMN